MTERASVVICTHTMARWSCLDAAVTSVREQDRRPDEIVLVVDHNDELLERCRTAFPGTTVVANAAKRGLAGARNTGIAAATGDVLVFLDDDARARPGWLRSLMAPYADPTVAGVGGAIEPLWERGRPRWFPSEFDWVVGCTYRGLPVRGTAEVRNLIGANMSFRRSVLDASGPFRDDLGRVGSTPLGCEETELCVRLSARLPEAKLVYEPRARVLHLVPAARGRVRYFGSRCFAEGISKARVVAMAGSERGLASERTYARVTLPRSAGRGIVDAFRGDLAGAARALAIVGGLGVTTAGYLTGRANQRMRGQETIE